MVGVFSDIGQSFLLCLPALWVNNMGTCTWDPAFKESKSGKKRWKNFKSIATARHTQAMIAWTELREGENRIDALLDQQRAAEESW